MKIVIEDGNKSYEFEAGDDELRLELEQAIVMPDYDELMIALVRATIQQKSLAIKAWRKVKRFIIQFDPEYTDEEMAYDMLDMRIKLQKNPGAQIDEKQIAELEQELLRKELIEKWSILKQ